MDSARRHRSSRLRPDLDVCWESLSPRHNLCLYRVPANLKKVLGLFAPFQSPLFVVISVFWGDKRICLSIFSNVFVYFLLLIPIV